MAFRFLKMDIQAISWNQLRKKQRLEGTLKSLLGNSLGNYWNDSPDVYGKRKRKQVSRFTTEAEEDHDEEKLQKRKNPKRLSRATSELLDGSEEIFPEKVSRVKRPR